MRARSSPPSRRAAPSPAGLPTRPAATEAIPTPRSLRPSCPVRPLRCRRRSSNRPHRGCSPSRPDTRTLRNRLTRICSSPPARRAALWPAAEPMCSVLREAKPTPHSLSPPSLLPAQRRTALPAQRAHTAPCVSISAFRIPPIPNFNSSIPRRGRHVNLVKFSVRMKNTHIGKNGA